MFWLHYPLFKITPVFIMGLIFGFYFPDQLFLASGMMMGFIILLTISLSFKKLALLTEILIYINLLGLGFFCWNIHYPLNDSLHYSHQIQSQEPSIFTGQITQRLKPNTYAERYVFETIQVQQQRANGYILISIPKKDVVELPQVGQKIRFIGALKPIPPAPFEGAFDYAAYLKNQKVFHQVHIPATEWWILKNEDFSLTYFLNTIRERIVENLIQSGATPNQTAIFKALFLGQRQDIDSEIYQDFIQAGVIHVLAISGLHIGIILWVFSLLLSPLEYLKKGKYLKVALLLIGLWFFALLTGLPASVVRACTMFTFITLALHFGRTTHLYHALVGSLFLILLFRPQFIFDVGFQLSYVAVFSIVWIQPLFKKCFAVKSKILSYPLDLLTVSLAAQIGVLPLSLYYFHQFPALFLCSNLLIIPIVTVLLMIGMPLLFVLSFTAVSWGIDGIFYLLDLMVEISHWTASFENFLFQHIPFSGMMLFTLSLLLIALVNLLKQPRFNRTILFLGSIILFQLSVIWEQQTTKQQAYILPVYKKSILIHQNQKQQNNYLSDSLNTFETNLLQQYQTHHFTESTNQQTLKNVLYVQSKKIFRIDASGVYLKNHTPDILWLTQSPKINLERLITETKPKQIVADGSNYPSLVQRWKQTCLQKNIPFHSTSEKGYYKID